MDLIKKKKPGEKFKPLSNRKVNIYRLGVGAHKRINLLDDDSSSDDDISRSKVSNYKVREER